MYVLATTGKEVTKQYPGLNDSGAGISMSKTVFLYVNITTIILFLVITIKKKTIGINVLAELIAKDYV